MAVVLDAGVLIAAANPEDEYRERAKAVFRRAVAREWGRIVTTDYVSGETLNFLRARVRGPEAERQALAILVGAVSRRPLVDEIRKIHGTRFRQAVVLFDKHRTRRLSFTDCTTLTVLEEDDVLATFDRGFRGLVPVVP